MWLDAILRCPRCSEEFDHYFTAPEGVEDVQEIVDPPKEWVVCPACQQGFAAEWAGWHAHEDAG